MAGQAIQRLKHSVTVPAQAVAHTAASALGRQDLAAGYAMNAAAAGQMSVPQAGQYAQRIKTAGRATRAGAGLAAAGAAGYAGLQVLNAGQNDPLSQMTQSLMNQGYSEEEAFKLATMEIHKQQFERERQAGGGAY